MTTAVRFTAGNRRVRLSQFKHEIERRGNPSPTVHFKTWHSGIARLGVLSKWRAFASGHVIGIYFVCEQDRASVPDERVGCILRSYGASNIGIRILAYPDAMPAQTRAMLDLLRARGPEGVSALDALRVIGCYRPAARVWQLKRAGYVITTTRKRGQTAVYRLVAL